VKKLNIALIPDYFFPTTFGAEMHVYNLAKQLYQRNISVSILTRNVPHLVRKKGNLQVYGFPSLFGSYHWYMKGYYLPLFDPLLSFIPLLKRGLFKKSIVHAHGPIVLSLAAYNKLSNFPLLLSVHDYWPVCFQRSLLLSDNKICNLNANCNKCLSTHMGNFSGLSKIIYFENKILLERIEKFIAVSHFVKNMLSRGGIPAKKIVVLHNWVDMKKIEAYHKDLPEKRENIGLFVGQISKQKGAHIAVEAMSKVVKDMPDFKFRVIGSGPLVSTLRRKVEKDGLSCSISLLGKVDSETLFEEYRRAKLFLCPSIWPDPCPTVVLEAMAFKLPIVASNIGGIPEMVKHGYNGFLFSPGNTDTLAEYVSKLISDEELCRRLGENSYSKVRSFDINSQVSKLIDLYSTITN